MFQLILPFTRSKTAGRGSGHRRKARFFQDTKAIPCVFCGVELTFETATIEHIIPKSKGGPNVQENLTLSCKPCNNNRMATPFEEWKKIAPYDKLVRALIKSHRIIGRCVR